MFQISLIARIAQKSNALIEYVGSPNDCHQHNRNENYQSDDQSHHCHISEVAGHLLLSTSSHKMNELKLTEI
jgi:hypothetical protein